MSIVHRRETYEVRSEQELLLLIRLLQLHGQLAA